MKYTKNYTPEGVCSKNMEIETEDYTISKISVTGGCEGNRQGVARLCQGKDIRDVVSILGGIDCKGKGTSCPDQLSKALTELMQEIEKKA